MFCIKIWVILLIFDKEHNNICSIPSIRDTLSWRVYFSTEKIIPFPSFFFYMANRKKSSRRGWRCVILLSFVLCFSLPFSSRKSNQPRTRESGTTKKPEEEEEEVEEEEEEGEENVNFESWIVETAHFPRWASGVEQARRDTGVRGVSRKVLTVNSFPGGMRLESARGAALPTSPPPPVTPSCTSSVLLPAGCIRILRLCLFIRRPIENFESRIFEKNVCKILFSFPRKIPDVTSERHDVGGHKDALCISRW